MNVLHVDHLTMQFGGVVAVDNFTMDVDEGEIVALIGPNGAGKTTAFNAITGVYEPSNGFVSFLNTPYVLNYPHSKKMKKNYLGSNPDMFTAQKIMIKSPDKITKLGIARTFQNIRLFKSMTVFENVLTAMHLRRKSNLFTAMFRINCKEEAAMCEKTNELLKLLNLYELRDNLATSLPYGKQRHLEIARALATEPKLLLLDEPAAGMNPQETEDLAAFIHRIRNDFQLSILLIEHHMNLVMDISDRIYVINQGVEIAHGTPHEIQQNPDVIAAYLGGDKDE